MDYAIRTTLNATEDQFDEVESKLREILKERGFGILTEIDVKKTLKEKLGVEVKKYKILGACNPPRAHKALNAEPDIGVMLPCNVVVYLNADGKIVVSAMNPETALGMTDNAEVHGVAKEVKELLDETLVEIHKEYS